MNKSQNEKREFEHFTSKQKMTGAQAILILAKHGITVTIEEANQIVELINFLAEVTIKQILSSSEQSTELYLD